MEKEIKGEPTHLCQGSTVGRHLYVWTHVLSLQIGPGEISSKEKKTWHPTAMIQCTIEWKAPAEPCPTLIWKKEKHFNILLINVRDRVYFFQTLSNGNFGASIALTTLRPWLILKGKLMTPRYDYYDSTSDRNEKKKRETFFFHGRLLKKRTDPKARLRRYG